MSNEDAAARSELMRERASLANQIEAAMARHDFETAMMLRPILADLDAEIEKLP